MSHRKKAVMGQTVFIEHLNTKGEIAWDTITVTCMFASGKYFYLKGKALNARMPQTFRSDHILQLFAADKTPVTKEALRIEAQMSPPASRFPLIKNCGPQSLQSPSLSNRLQAIAVSLFNRRLQ